MSLKLNSKKFYWFSLSINNSDIYVNVDDEQRVTRNERKEFYKGIFTERKPTDFVYMGGRNLKTFIKTGIPIFFLVSDDIIKKFIEYKITGYGSYKVKIKLKDGSINSDYNALYYTTFAGPINMEKCEVVYEKIKGKESETKMLKGIHFSESSWDGSDFFIHENSKVISITNRVKEIFDKSNIKGLKIVAHEDKTFFPH